MSDRCPACGAICESYEECARCAEHKHPFVETIDQVQDAILALERPAEAWLRWPWPALDALTGGMASGDVWFVCADSGGGKTTFVASLVDEWFLAGKKVFVLPLETTANKFRTYWAAMRAKVHPGDLFSGDYLNRPNAAAIREAVRQELTWQHSDEPAASVRIKGVREITLARLGEAVREAKDFGADVVIVDHIDHVGTEPGANAFQVTERVNKGALDLALRHDVLLLFTSQLNLETQRGNGDHLSKFQAPRDTHVFMGNEKRKVATGMLGLFRPIRAPKPGEDPKAYAEALKRARQGEGVVEMLEPNTMGVVNMKSRNGKAVRAQCLLGFRQGRIVNRTVLPHTLRGSAQALEFSSVGVNNGPPE